MNIKSTTLMKISLGIIAGVTIMTMFDEWGTGHQHIPQQAIIVLLAILVALFSGIAESYNVMMSKLLDMLRDLEKSADKALKKAIELDKVAKELSETNDVVNDPEESGTGKG